ncbi:hypothetical protein SUNI508_00522 [Seiridium unicorne]|uniref:Uncharacterized protein n=1 Tax=Seiridium unicorne TaxID=138068 RepID=A0ABR2V6Z7_9PEZI
MRLSYMILGALATVALAAPHNLKDREALAQPEPVATADAVAKRVPDRNEGFQPCLSHEYGKRDRNGTEYGKRDHNGTEYGKRDRNGTEYGKRDRNGTKLQLCHSLFWTDEYGKRDRNGTEYGKREPVEESA